MAMTQYYKEQLESGLLYQDFVYEILHRNGIATVAYSSKTFQTHFGENKAKMEIKHDKEMKNTGNLWIEVAEKTNPENLRWVESGICRDCIEYIIGDYDIIYRMATTTLRAFRPRYTEMENRLRTSRGFLLPTAVAGRAAIQVMEVNLSQEMKEVLNRQLAEGAINAKKEMQELISMMKVDPSQMKLF